MMAMDTRGGRSCSFPRPEPRHRPLSLTRLALEALGLRVSWARSLQRSLPPGAGTVSTPTHSLWFVRLEGGGSV